MSNDIELNLMIVLRDIREELMVQTGYIKELLNIIKRNSEVTK